mmetsp:Transcript_50818/g.145880  ORF Transcript_50818/g.145880 Transcript_50818/m.145880 type:complete len:248 (-) Transcript_50818:187-930(-)
MGISHSAHSDGTAATAAAAGAASPSEDWPWVWAIQDCEVLDWRPGLSPDEVVAQSSRQSPLPVEIVDCVLLGDKKCACQVARLQELGVTHVLCVAGPAGRGPVDEYAVASIAFKEIDAEDDEGYPMLPKHLSEARAFIDLARQAGGRCLVHCVAGINRSGVLVAAEMLLFTRRTVLEVVKHCRCQRGNAYLWNRTFQEQLVALARSEGLLGAKPGDEGSVVATCAPQPPSNDGRAVLRPIDALFRLT